MKAQPKVLIVDDERGILSALTRLLRNEGYTLLTAGSAFDALELLEQHCRSERAVDLVMSDQRMPGMQGSEFFEIVKRKYPETIRILFSGYADAEEVHHAFDSGAICLFFAKPWNDVDVRMTLRRALEEGPLGRTRDRHREAAESGRPPADPDPEIGLGSSGSAGSSGQP